MVFIAGLLAFTLARKWFLFLFFVGSQSEEEFWSKKKGSDGNKEK